MKLYFLGTGAGIPSRDRNVSSLALMMPEYHGETWLFDCGEATQHQILSSPIKLSKISKIFITHLHGDHIFGLPGLLGSRSFQGCEAPLTVIGPQGLRSFIEVSLEVSKTYLKYPIEFIEVEDRMSLTEENFSIQIRLLEHGIPSYGYRIEEKEISGSLDVKRLKALGIQPGPLYQEIKQGKLIQLPNGQTINGSDYVGPPKPGIRLAILGDTKFTPVSIELAADVDVLVHEATYRSGQEERATKYFHSTCLQAAQVAMESHVQQLILNHISSRHLPGEWNQILVEAQQLFSNTHLSTDGWSYEIPIKSGDNTK
ncbi:ribonuclease Z [Hazenella coriacea]|uniref:Ribonuclease Z n=1 Tax=Hazenella coriacea TaxID=1179467 RepID=A0A4R3LET7_9BACL|nr:ribonuclease Z [Hazenella coriacea]TCS96864.1 RNAse Z [Hazenella coriacea]